MGVTIKDIAREAGVSYETVSRALSNRGRVGKDTAARIREVAKRLNYRPNAVARGLRSKTTQTLGVVFPCIYANEFYAGIYRGIEDEALRHGYILFLCNSDFDAKREAAYVEALHARRVDALIFAPADLYEANDPNGTLLQDLRDRFGMVMVLIDRRVPGLDCDYVATDHYAGATLAVRHLLDLGHRRVACLATSPVSSVQDRVQAYRDALAGAGIERDEAWLRLSTDNYEESGASEMSQILALPAERRPTAVFATNDMVAAGAMRQALEQGLEVPGDLSIVGFDDLRLATSLPVPLTTVRQDLLAIGHQAGRAAIGRIGKPDSHGPGRDHSVVPTLVERASSAPPKA